MKPLVCVGIALAMLASASVALADTFSPKGAVQEQTVTLSGTAKPSSSMSGYFYCAAGCGETHIGAVTADKEGNYTLTFKVPAGAPLGAAYVKIGCDKCGNGWREVKGLQIVKPRPGPCAKVSGHPGGVCK